LLSGEPVKESPSINTETEERMLEVMDMDEKASRAKPLSLALIGAGGYGSHHIRHIRGLAAQGMVRLTAAADIFKGPKLELRRDELLAANVRCYTDYRELLRKEEGIDVVIIATPIPLHEEMAHAALETGAAIYLEKPPVPTIQQWLKLVEADRQHRIAVGFQMIAMTHLRVLRGWIESGALGTIRSISFGSALPRDTAYFRRARWAGKLTLDGQPVFDGPATNAISHLLNSVFYLAGGTVRAPYAVPDEVAGEFYRARRDIESYDLASFAGTFSSGTSFAGTVGHCVADNMDYAFRVHGSRGTAWLEESGSRLGSDCGMMAIHDPGSDGKSHSDHYRQTMEWAAGVRPAPVVSLRDCEAYMRAVCAGLISSGRIHPIPDEASSNHGEGDTCIRSVNGLADAIRASCREGLPLSALGLPWAQAGAPTRTGTVNTIDLASFAN
jgi:predicted dehydrogenase